MIGLICHPRENEGLKAPWHGRIYRPSNFVQAAESLASFIYAERRRQREIAPFLPICLVPFAMQACSLLWVPKDFGGPEIPIRDFMLVVDVLARADASIGWCAANASTNSVLSATFLAQSFERFGTMARP